MADRQPLTLGEILLLVAIVALAGGLRAGYVMTCADNAHNAGPLLVETPPPDLDTLVHNLRDQQRFAVHSSLTDTDVDTAHVSPGYPILMAVVSRFVEDAALASTMRWLQCALGALTAGLYFLFARRAFHHPPVAALAGLLCAIHPFWIIDTAALADGVTATFLLALVLFLGARASQVNAPLSRFLYGLTLAALALVRAALLPFAIVALAWFLWRSRTLVQGWLAAALAFLGFVIGLAPWVVRNWQQFHEPLPIVDSTYYHLWVGNKPAQPREPAVDQPVDTETLPATLEGRYADEILREMRDHPADTVRRRLRAGLNFLFGERWLNQGQLADQISSEETMPPWLAAAYPVVLEGTMLVLVMLGLLGWRWTYVWRYSAMPATLAMIWIPLPYILSHAEALSGPRLPLDGVLLMYTAFVLACLFPGRRQLWSGESSRGEAEIS
jgi:hypothetical protein